MAFGIAAVKKALDGDDVNAPNLSKYKRELEEQSGIAYDQSAAQQLWAQQQWDQQQDMLRQALATQEGIMGRQLSAADLASMDWQSIYRPQALQAAADAERYADPAFQEQEAARYMAAVQQTVDAQRQNAQRQLEAYGIDPSQTRAQAMDLSARINMAAQQAAAGNIGRDAAQQKAFALQDRSHAMGAAQQAMAQQQYGMAAGLAGQGLQQQMAGTQLGASTMGTGQGWQAQGAGLTSQAMGAAQQNFQNKMLADQMSGQGWQALGQLGGQALGAYLTGGMSLAGPSAAGALGGGAAATQPASSFNSSYTSAFSPPPQNNQFMVYGPPGAEEGGSVPHDMSAIPGPTDTVPAMLAEGEFVISAEAVKEIGLDKLRKMNDKFKEQNAQYEEAPSPAASPEAIPLGGGVQGFNNGGLVDAPMPQTMSVAPQPAQMPTPPNAWEGMAASGAGFANLMSTNTPTGSATASDLFDF